MSLQTGTADRRGSVPTIAIVMLIGMVAVVGIGIFLVGSVLVETTTATAETDRVEQGFVQLSVDIESVATSDGRTATIDLAIGEAGGAVTKRDTGTITIRILGESEPILETTVGSIEYENDGTKIAYQAGGIWRSEGDGTTMVSAPEMYYRDGTLNMPILDLEGEQILSGESITVSAAGTDASMTDTTSVEGELVTVTIQSEFYQGWATFFETRTHDNAVLVDHRNETVEVRFGRPTLDGDFEDAVRAEGDVVFNGNGCIEGNITTSGDVDETPQCRDAAVTAESSDEPIESIDDAVNLSVEMAQEQGTPLTNQTILSNETYFVDGDLYREDQHNIQVDVSDGDVTIVVDGHIALNNSNFNVTGLDESDGNVYVYTTGDVAMQGGQTGVHTEEAGDEGSADRFQLYGTSDMHFAIGQGEFTGTVYAPRDGPANGTNEAAEKYNLSAAVACQSIDGADPDVCLGQGHVRFHGAIVSGPIAVEQNSLLTHDETLEGVVPELSLEGVVLPPELIHLNVVRHEVSVSDG